ncbi:MAG: Ig-like domain-containing protein [Muribaculaceae bacterium]|nr:Ig-like domain-containing protein [Muribaculaceae bacterium]
MSKIFRFLMFVVCMMAGLQSGAQLVDRATFEQHRAAAHSFGGTLRTAASAPITLSQNPFEFEQFSIQNGGTAQVKLYFNTAVMASYRSECCPRVGEFQLALPAGCSVTAVTRGADLQSSITVTGNFDTDARTLYFLAYGMCSAAEMSQFPTGRIHYATITIKATNASPGTKTMTMSNAAFSMADEPSEFIISGTSNYSFSVVQLVTGISLNKTSATINNGETLQLTYSVTPSNASNKTVTWTSSNAAIATVDNTGLVTAKAFGSATITATTTDGTNLSASCQVTVTPQLATGISLNQSSAEISVGESITLVATVSPSNTTNPAVKWTTENAAVATVVRGVVRGVGEGECYITATTQDGTNLSAQCLVAVSGSADVKVTNVTLSETNVTLTEGSSTVITATVLPENATNKTLAWTSSNTAVATINANGVLQAVAAGTATITATTTDGSNISATCNVTVNSSTVNVPNYLSVGDLPEMVAGQAFVIPIALTNTDPITAIQADLYLPSGIEPNYNDDDQFVWLDEDRKGRGHVVSATVSAVATRIMVSSSRNAAFQGNEGTVLYISLKVNPEQVTGVYGIDLKNIILSSTSGEMFEAPNVKINVGVAAYHSGDANGDGYIDDTDYVITANYILAQNPSNFVFSAADMSGDGRVYVNDLPLIIDAAMNFDFDSMSFAPQRAPKRASSTDALYVNDFDLAGGATKTVSIMLDNTTAFSAVQCDIALPNGLTIVQQTDEWGDPAYALLASARSDDHDAWSDIASTGDVRVIITNSISRRLKGNSGAVATFIVQSANGFSGEHELVLKNIVCADANAVRYALPDAVCLVNHAVNIPGDVDGNGAVNGTDLNILINIILGKDNADNYGGRANVNGEGGVDGNDLNKLINIILGK